MAIHGEIGAGAAPGGQQGTTPSGTGESSRGNAVFNSSTWANGRSSGWAIPVTGDFEIVIQAPGSNPTHVINRVTAAELRDTAATTAGTNLSGIEHLRIGDSDSGSFSYIVLIARTSSNVLLYQRANNNTSSIQIYPITYSAARGQRGPTGAEGPPGEQGQPGADGQPGAGGQPGADGQPGDQGPPGDKGPVGDKGPIGDQGPVGEKGPPGDQGSGSTGLTSVSTTAPITGAGTSGSPVALAHDTSLRVVSGQLQVDPAIVQRPAGITNLPVPLVNKQRYVLLQEDTIDQSVFATAVLQSQPQQRNATINMNGFNGVRAYSSSYNGQQASILRNRVVLSFHSTPASPPMRLFWGTAVGSQTQYTRPQTLSLIHI